MSEERTPGALGSNHGLGVCHPERCHAGRDGDCIDPRCPQLRDGEPAKSGRHCPLDMDDSDDSWLDDDGEWCDRCNGDGRDPMNDYLLPCPACQGEQH